MKREPSPLISALFIVGLLVGGGALCVLIEFANRNWPTANQYAPIAGLTIFAVILIFAAVESTRARQKRNQVRRGFGSESDFILMLQSNDYYDCINAIRALARIGTIASVDGLISLRSSVRSIPATPMSNYTGGMRSVPDYKAEASRAILEILERGGPFQDDLVSHVLVRLYQWEDPYRNDPADVHFVRRCKDLLEPR